MEFHFLHLAVFACLIALGTGQGDGEYPVISTKSGRIKGKIQKLANGQKVAAFLGIFFAEPPVGPLRFKVKVFRSFRKFA